MRLVYVFLLSLIISACGGYQPVPKMAKKIFQEPVLVKVSLNEKDPQSGQYIEEELIKTVINRLNIKVTHNAKIAKNYIVVTVYAVNTSVANKDDDGNVIRYSVNAAIKFAVQDKYGFWFKNIVANEFVSVKAKSILSENEKAKAEKIAIQKALDDFVVAVANRAKEVEQKKLKPKNEPKEEKTIEVAPVVEENNSLNEYEDIPEPTPSQTKPSQEPLNYYLIDKNSTNDKLVEIKL